MTEVGQVVVGGMKRPHAFENAVGAGRVSTRSSSASGKNRVEDLAVGLGVEVAGGVVFDHDVEQTLRLDAVSLAGKKRNDGGVLDNVGARRFVPGRLVDIAHPVQAGQGLLTSSGATGRHPALEQQAVRVCVRLVLEHALVAEFAELRHDALRSVGRVFLVGARKHGQDGVEVSSPRLGRVVPAEKVVHHLPQQVFRFVTLSFLRERVEDDGEAAALGIILQSSVQL